MSSLLQDSRHPLLDRLGAQVRSLRARKGLTRKGLAAAAGVSERHLANLEQGQGNASLLVLQDIASALQCQLAELLGDFTTSSAEWMLLRQLLANRDEDELKRVREAALQALGEGADASAQSPRRTRFALIGLRGAGKSTIGHKLAYGLGCTFVELNQHIEAQAGCSVAEIQALYGMTGYRRYEHRALAAVIDAHQQCVIATPGGLVSDLASFELLLKHCTTIWLQADPQDHMARVMAQGDMRPMAASREAMEDLQRILDGRRPFYEKADFTLNTSTHSEARCVELLMDWVRGPRTPAPRPRGLASVDF
jgi:XRE family transcriptional regulator, aerobic/anaerobic benzoate catabolism transcriptional regulator